MLRYTIRRLLGSLLTIFVVISLVFLILRIQPPSAYFEQGQWEKMSPANRNSQLYQLGLTSDMQGTLLSPVEQLVRFYSKFFTKFDLGESTVLRKGVSVVDLIREKASFSIWLGLAVTVVELLIGYVVGVLTAKYKGKWFDGLFMFYNVLAMAIPLTVLYLFMQIFFSNTFGWPLIHKAGSFRSWYSPFMIMVLTGFSSTALWLRRYTVDQLNSDYVKLAYAKGLPGTKVMFTHVLRNAYTPFAYNLPAAFIWTISGTVLIESAFGIPGMGQFFLQAIGRHDNNVVQAITFLYVILGVLSVFLGDILAAAVDPRIRLYTSKVKVVKSAEVDADTGTDKSVTKEGGGVGV